MAISSVDKDNIVQRIIYKIWGQGGHFLKKCANQKLNGKSTVWVDIGDRAALEKTCQVLRNLKASVHGESQPFNRSNRNNNSIELNNTLIPRVFVPSLTHKATFNGIKVNDNDVLLCHEHDRITHSHSKWMCLH